MSSNTILVVEHEKRAARSLKEHLCKEGFDVVVARNGEEGLWKAVTERPRAVILNSRLPYVSGWEVCEEIKYSSATRHIPVIALSARPGPRDYARAFLARCDAHLTGVVDHAACVDAVNRLAGA